MCLVARQDEAWRCAILLMLKLPRNAVRKSGRQDYTAKSTRPSGMSVGNTYQARQAADIAFDEMPNCAITSALAGGELDCRPGWAGHLMEPMSMGLIIHAAIEKSR